MFCFFIMVMAAVPIIQGVSAELQADGQWSKWGMWSSCPCELRKKERRRTCRKFIGENQKCSGHEIESIRCDEECTKVRNVEGDKELLYFRKLFLTHNEAEQHCRSVNATLAVIKTFRIHNAIASKIRHMHLRLLDKDRQYHIGLKEHSKGWRWSDGTVAPNRAKENETKEPHEFEMWNDKKNYQTKHKCAAMSKSYCRHLTRGYSPYNCWEKLPCSYRRPFVCQRTNYSNILQNVDKRKRPRPCAKPKCKKVVSCPLLPIHYNGVSDPPYGGYDRFRSGDTVRFSCFSDQYQLVGVETIECLKNGTWSDKIPTCEVTTDCDFSFGPKRMCWYSHVKQPGKSRSRWYAVKLKQRRNFAAYAWLLPAVMQSPLFTAKQGPRCLIFKYKLLLGDPWLEVEIGNHTWTRAAFERRGVWHKARIHIDQTEEKMKVSFRAKSGGVFLDDIKLLLKACPTYTSQPDHPIEASTPRTPTILSRTAVECDFENHKKALCEYTFTGGARWMKRELCQCHKLGHVARVSVYGEMKSVLQSPPFNAQSQKHCLRFLYLLQSPQSFIPNLLVDFGSRSWTPRVILKDKWIIAQINVTESHKLQKIKFIVFTGTISIDNITLEDKACGEISEVALDKPEDPTQVDVIAGLAETLVNIRSEKGTKALKLTPESPFPWYDWSSWGSWSDCVADTDGAPTSRRHRHCLGPRMDVIQCRGNKTESSRSRCPVEAFSSGGLEVLLYKHITLTHHKAMSYCCQLGGTLLKMGSRGMHYEIEAAVKRHRDYSDENVAYHIGLRQRGKRWRWPDLDKASDIIRRRASVVKPYEAWSDSGKVQGDKCAALSSYICHNLRYDYRYGRYETCWITVNCTSQRPFICERAHNPCSFKCKNGGTCILKDNSVTCNCTEDFYGQRCEFERYPCLSLPCLNGGICEHNSQEPLNYKCYCLPEFYGKKCENQISFLRKRTAHVEYMLYKTPKLSHSKSAKFCKQFNGTLAMPRNRFAMNIIFKEFQRRKDGRSHWYHIGLRRKKAGWRWEDGARAPLNQTDDFWGLCGSLRKDRCEKHWSQCYGACHCADREPFLCERKLNACSVPSCQNGGVCVATNSSYNCRCPSGYGGRHCEEKQSPCTSLPCQHGGTCVDKPNTIMGFSCECQHTATGRYCEADKDPCLSLPCLFGGTCIADLKLFSRSACLCPLYTRGLNCEYDNFSCSSSWKCLNGGTCIKKKNRYSRDKCLCPPGWSGFYCNHKMVADRKGMSKRDTPH